jgi:hypothetical protein
LTAAPASPPRPGNPAAALDLARELLVAQVHDLTRDPDTLDPDAVATTERLRERCVRLRAAGQPAQARRVLARLIDHERRRQAREAQAQARRGDVPSLLEQVRDAVTSSTGSGHRSSSGPHRSPIGLTAAELLGEIERTVGHRYTTALHRDVWAWVRTHAANPATVDTLSGWVSRARGVVDPPRPVALAAPCPQCGRAVAHVVDDTGERVRRPALQIDRVTGNATCLTPGCDAVWTPDRWPLLARVLRQQAREREQCSNPACSAASGHSGPCPPPGWSRRQVRRVSTPAAGRVTAP